LYSSEVYFKAALSIFSYTFTILGWWFVFKLIYNPCRRVTTYCKMSAS